MKLTRPLTEYAKEKLEEAAAILEILRSDESRANNKMASHELLNAKLMVQRIIKSNDLSRKRFYSAGGSTAE